MSRARVSRVVIVDPEAGVAQVIVPDYQLSLAIGKEGQNARLAARLTGWRIDIRPDSPGADASVAPENAAGERGERAGQGGQSGPGESGPRGGQRSDGALARAGRDAPGSARTMARAPD